MRRPERGVLCPGCPHRAAYVTVREGVGRGRGKVYCGDAGCPAVGPVHPAAANVAGGDAALLARYRQEVPDGSDGRRARVCVHFVTDRALVAQDDAGLPRDLSREGESVLLCILASSAASTTREAAEDLAERARGLGARDVGIVDPFDTLGCTEAARGLTDEPGVHAIVFASPCARLIGADEPVEVDRFACTGCHRCKQITGCPALTFAPPAYEIDPDACAGCDLCADYCRLHVILSPRQRLTLDERRRARYDRLG